MSVSEYARADYYTKKAFSENYPARSVYKLEEIDKKFGVLKNAKRVLDLGASPGSWSEYVLRHLPKDALLVACDLNEMSKSIHDERLVFIQGDMTERETYEKIVSHSPFDCVVCDAAPLTTGNKTVDTARQNNLVELAAQYAKETLKTGGSFAVKVFQGGGEGDMMKKMRKEYESVKIFKPKACRAKSVETYIIAISFKRMI